MSNIQTFKIFWRGIEIDVKYENPYFQMSDFSISHFDIYTKDKQPLPITETGYRSHFLHDDEVQQYGGPSEYFNAWIESEAKTQNWKPIPKQAEQLSLF